MELIEQSSNNFLTHLQEEIKRRKRDKSDYLIATNAYDQKFIELFDQKRAFEQAIINLGEITGTIIELINIDNALDSQDEEDRQSISLWGLHEKHKKNMSGDFNRAIDHIRKANPKGKFKLAKIQHPEGKYNVITLDKDWYSCSNSNQLVVSAFKMACLAYYPSDITFEAKVVPRAELHSKKVQIINELYKDYHNLEPWKSGKCKFDKYLDTSFTEYLSTQSKERKQSYMTFNKEIMNKAHKESISPFRDQSIKNTTIEISKMNYFDKMRGNLGRLNEDIQPLMTDQSYHYELQSNDLFNTNMNKTQSVCSAHNRSSSSHRKYFGLNRKFLINKQGLSANTTGYKFKSPAKYHSKSRLSSRNYSDHEQII